MPRKKQVGKKREKKQYVIGRQEKGLCSLVAKASGETADGRNLELARCFTSLSQAMQMACELDVGVFEVRGREWPEQLREIKVDLRTVASLPFLGCYVVKDHLLAGPTFLTPSYNESLDRITALSEAGVNCMVSLVGLNELFATRDLLEKASAAAHWEQHFFPISDRQVPSPSQIKLILGVIDRALDRKLTLYVSCLAGCGRTGVVIGSWLAQHHEGRGDQEPLDVLAEIRWHCGLFSLSPETEEQRDFVRNWPPGGSSRS